MKKIISSLLFLAGIQGFSNTCNFANNPDIFLDRVIKKKFKLKKDRMIFFVIATMLKWLIIQLKMRIIMLI